MITISKAEMLSKIVESGNVPFRIRFVKASGKDAGQIAEKVCYYGAPKPHPPAPSPGERGSADNSPLQWRGAGGEARKPRKNHLESNAIPLTEFATGRMLTPFISHILYFNGKQVIH